VKDIRSPGASTVTTSKKHFSPQHSEKHSTKPPTVERNPYKNIEQALDEARGKLEKMKGTPGLLETLSDVN